MKKFYYRKGERNRGPIDESSLVDLVKEGYLSGNTLIWREGMQEWQTVGQTELSVYISQSPGIITQQMPIYNPSQPMGGPYPPGQMATPPGGIPVVVYNQLPMQTIIHDSSLIYPSGSSVSPHVALLNIFFPGLAQMIFGQVGKGILLLFMSLFFLVITLTMSYWFVTLPVIIDAYMVGSRLRAGKTVGRWAFFPS